MKIRLLMPIAVLIGAVGCGSGDETGPGVPKNEPETSLSSKRMNDLNDYQTVNLELNGHPIKAWIADDAFKIKEGLMWLNDREVGPDEGMIFVFPYPEPQSFWMRNTLIPLDIVFLDEKGRILNVAHGKPLDEETKLRSEGPALYVIELKAGTVDRLGAKAGQVVEVPSVLKSKD